MRGFVLEVIELCTSACTAIRAIAPPDAAGDVVRLANEAQLAIQGPLWRREVTLTREEESAWCMAYRSVNDALFDYGRRWQRWDEQRTLDEFVRDSEVVRLAATQAFEDRR